MSKTSNDLILKAFDAYDELDKVCFDTCFKNFYDKVKSSQEICYGKKNEK